MNDFRWMITIIFIQAVAAFAFIDRLRLRGGSQENDAIIDDGSPRSTFDIGYNSIRPTQQREITGQDSAEGRHLPAAISLLVPPSDLLLNKQKLWSIRGSPKWQLGSISMNEKGLTSSGPFYSALQAWRIKALSESKSTKQKRELPSGTIAVNILEISQLIFTPAAHRIGADVLNGCIVVAIISPRSAIFARIPPGLHEDDEFATEPSDSVTDMLMKLRGVYRTWKEHNVKAQALVVAPHPKGSNEILKPITVEHIVKGIKEMGLQVTTDKYQLGALRKVPLIDENPLLGTVVVDGGNKRKKEWPQVWIEGRKVKLEPLP